MTTRSIPITDLPAWPRLLPRALAAAYVGVSPNQFDLEVQEGVWPAALPRGRKGGKLTWDRVQLDAAVDRLAGALDKPGVSGPTVTTPEAEPDLLLKWRERLHGTPSISGPNQTG